MPYTTLSTTCSPACHNVQVIYIFNLIKIQIEKKQENEIKEKSQRNGGELQRSQEQENIPI